MTDQRQPLGGGPPTPVACYFPVTSFDLSVLVVLSQASWHLNLSCLDARPLSPEGLTWVGWVRPEHQCWLPRDSDVRPEGKPLSQARVHDGAEQAGRDARPSTLPGPQLPALQEWMGHSRESSPRAPKVLSL